MTGRLFIQLDEKLAVQLRDFIGSECIADEIRTALARLVAIGARKTMRAIRHNHLGLTEQASELAVIDDSCSKKLRLDVTESEKELISSFIEKIAPSINISGIKNQVKLRRRFCVAYAVLLYLKRDIIAA
ncbi:MAG: hypothetical protein ACTSP4_11340 [Candidatus Hodarchaeales archaeon]